MKKNYELSGMSCGGCVSNVKKSLLELPFVVDADIQLNPQHAVLTMTQLVGLEELQSHLKKSGNYTITEIV